MCSAVWFQSPAPRTSQKPSASTAPPASLQLLWKASSALLKWLLVIKRGRGMKLGSSRGTHGSKL